MWKPIKKTVAPGDDFVVLTNPRVCKHFEATMNITSTGTGASDAVGLWATVSDFARISDPADAIWFSLVDSEVESMVDGIITTANVGLEFPVTAIRFENAPGSAYPYIVEVLYSGA